MNRVRIGCAITVIIGAIYASVGIFDSLLHFAIGVCIVSAAVIGYGWADFYDSYRDEELRRYRAEVWHRRDLEAREQQRVANVYEFPRDGIER